MTLLCTHSSFHALRGHVMSHHVNKYLIIGLHKIMRCDMTWHDSEYNFESYHTSYASISRGSFNTNLISYFIRVYNMITYDPISYHISINHPDIIHHLYIFCSGHHHESYDTDYIWSYIPMNQIFYRHLDHSNIPNILSKIYTPFTNQSHSISSWQNILQPFFDNSIFNYLYAIHMQYHPLLHNARYTTSFTFEFYVCIVRRAGVLSRKL